VLATLRPDVVLEVLASDDERCWLVTRDAGEKIRSRIVSAGDVPLLEPVLAAYGDLQRRAAGCVPELLAAGALDRRSAHVGELLAAALQADEESDGEGQAEPLTAGERERLMSVVPKLESVASRAAALVPDSIEHSDLHDGNVFVLGDVCRVGDFGDSCVSAPLASLVVVQGSLVHRIGVAPDGPEVARLYRAALEPWTDRASMADLLELVDTVRPIGMLGRGLTWRALITSIGVEPMRPYGDGWSAWARDLLTALESTPD
jgi:hypothetical protein